MRQCPEILEGFHLEALAGRIWMGHLQEQSSQRQVVSVYTTWELVLARARLAFIVISWKITGGNYHVEPSFRESEGPTSIQLCLTRYVNAKYLHS